MAPESSSEQLCRRVSWSIGLRSLLANVDGAIVTFVYLAFLAPAEKGDTDRGALIDTIAFVVVLAVAVAVMSWHCNRLLERSLAWLTEEREPTPRDRDDTLALPFRLAASPLVAWAVAAAIFGPSSLLFGHSAGHVLRISASILLGGVVSCAISYLLIERACRPLFVLALAGGARPTRVISPGVGTRLVLTWALVSGVPLIGLALLPLQAREATGDADIGGAVVALSLMGLVFGALATVAVSRSVSEPLAEVRRAVGRVEAGDLTVEVPVDDAGEVGMLQVGLNRMVGGLRERARIADLFGRHVGAEVAALALEQETGLRSEQREVSVLFVDIVGSSAMAEVLSPSGVVETLNAYFTTVVEVVSAEGGWVNKFEGDGALCVFGAPAVQADHAARALRAARRLDRELRVLAATYPGVDAAIGVSSGLAVAGNVGTPARYEYTVIGAPVNEAARLTDLAKDREARVLASWAAISRSGDESANWTDCGTVALRGLNQPTTIGEPASPSRQPSQ